jgi:hypothetical protein
VFSILIGFNKDPEPAFYLNTDPDSGGHTNADPEPGQTLSQKRVECLHEIYT